VLKSRIENLDPTVVCVHNIPVAVGIYRNSCGIVQLAGSGTWLAKSSDKYQIRIKTNDSVPRWIRYHKFAAGRDGYPIGAVQLFPAID
jgi:hypothetical protein